jgi:hypothetical protein
VYSVFLYLLFAPLVDPSAAAPDTLVLCPPEFRSVLAPWEALRQRQGHRILVIPPPQKATEIQATIRSAGESGQLRYLVLIGDVPARHDGRNESSRPEIPTNYVPATINTCWGSQPTIATDVPYADLDGDQLPELAVGRIPADSAEELAAVVRKIARYEQYSQRASPAQRLNLVAGIGGFGAVADALVEAAARQVFLQTVPANWDVQYTSANPHSASCPPPEELHARIRRQLSERALAWIYMGHGLPTELDRVRTPRGFEPILSTADVPGLRCGPQSPLAVLMACYTGAFDSRPDSLAEELLLAEQGPIAVIAATRVTMPYGNTVLGCELLRACVQDRPNELGRIMQLAQRRALEEASDDSLRSSLDLVAQGISPPPVDLSAERREHVWMYHLFGDPLTVLRPATASVARSNEGTSVR